MTDDPFFDPETMYQAPGVNPARAGMDDKFVALVADLHRLAAMPENQARAELQRRIAAGLAVEDALELAYLAGRLAVAMAVFQKAVLEATPRPPGNRVS